MQHHLVDESDLTHRVRPGVFADAAAISQMATGDFDLSKEAQLAAIAIIEERLSVPSGDDYFTIVVEDREALHLRGWLSAGGSRGQEHKGWAEIYAMEVDPTATNTYFEEALLKVALSALQLAQFAGVTILVDDRDELRRELFEDLEFIVESDNEVDRPRGHDLRYSLDLLRNDQPTTMGATNEANLRL